MYRNSIFYIIMVILILSIVIIPTQWFGAMLKEDVNGFRGRIAEILEKGADSPELDENCSALQDNWDHHMKHWSFVINHAAIEKVDLGICTFLELVRQGDFNAASVEAKRLDKIFEITANQDTLSALNIF